MSWRLYSVAVLLASSSMALAQPPVGEDLNDLQEKAIKAAVARVAPSVVQIETVGGTELIAAGPRGMQIRKGVGPTTGLVVAIDGYIISSAFNFANKPTAIFVTVPGQKERYSAKVICTDQTRMTTLLKIDANALTVPTASPKKDLKVGQWATALGRAVDLIEDRELKNPPSVSVGIVSALNRVWGKAVQTDAKVSPANYGGPLVDVAGRVIGVLVPASPRSEGETAGTEWYDSGIGFAIPLEDINAVLAKMREGKDLHKGQLGVAMQGTDQIAGAPTIANVLPDSAAAKGGIKAGDTIKSVDGHAVGNQAQLLHQLGNKYEGDEITIEIQRGAETIKIEKLKLSGAVTVQSQGFLGVLPLRDDPAEGEEIRFVYPDSPADKAGLKAGDRITKLGVGAQPLQPINGRDAFSAALNKLAAGTEIKLEVIRKEGNKTEPITVKLGSLPEAVADKLPEKSSAGKALEPRKGDPNPPMPKKEKAETGLLKRSNAARDHDYWVFVPKDYDPNVAYGIVLWLHPVGKNKDEDFEAFKDAWEDYCSANHLILVMPKAENENGWLASESDFVQQCVRDTMAQYTTDKSRVVAHGMGIGGQMAYYLGFNARDLFRGVGNTGAVLASQVKDNLQNQPLSFYLVAGGKDPLAKDIQDSKAKLADKKFPVVYREIANMGHQYLDPKTLAELVRWIDTLDKQ